jgi:hypothetical protein
VILTQKKKKNKQREERENEMATRKVKKQNAEFHTQKTFSTSLQIFQTV